MSKNILIVGAGQLGSRHLQGILRYSDNKLNVFVVDKSVESLKLAELRANEIPNTHTVYYTSNWSDIKVKTFDFVLIATNSNVREEILNYVADSFEIKYLLLEKVLFQDISAYDRVYKKIEKCNIATYVNHPRRMFESYHDLRNSLVESPKVYQYVGSNWGLACNALHFLDLFSYLANSKVVTMNFNGIDKKIINSKREGFIEFTGSVVGALEDNSNFIITSFEEQQALGTLTIFDSYNRYVINEVGTPQIINFLAQEKLKQVTHTFKTEYQSTLSCTILKSLFENGKVNLPTYEEASNLHKLFISWFAKIGQRFKSC